MTRLSEQQCFEIADAFSCIHKLLHHWWFSCTITSDELGFSMSPDMHGLDESLLKFRGFSDPYDLSYPKTQPSFITAFKKDLTQIVETRTQSILDPMRFYNDDKARWEKYTKSDYRSPPIEDVRALLEQRGIILSERTPTPPQDYPRIIPFSEADYLSLPDLIGKFDALDIQSVNLSVGLDGPTVLIRFDRADPDGDIEYNSAPHNKESLTDALLSVYQQIQHR